MLSRIVSRLLILASLATLAGITYYFMNEYRLLRRRELAVKKLSDLGATQGPCAALAELRWADPEDAELQQGLSSLRSRFVTQIVGDEDLRGRRVLVAAEREGLIDRALCEEIRLSHEVGEVHPVLALLRYTREGGNPCEEEPRLATVLDGLGSHRPAMLRALMRDVHELGCLSPGLSEKLAAMVADAAAEAPALFDGLESSRLATFVAERAPLQAAQLGCGVKARGQRSELGSALGCPPDARRALVHYRASAELPASSGLPAVPAGTELGLLRADGPFCDVIPAESGEWARTVACNALRLSSDVVVGVRIEALSLDEGSTFGRSDADLVAGLGGYAGASGKLGAAKQEPDVRSWYAYDRDGKALGVTRRIDLGAALASLGEAVPEGPLRASCKRSGARYCYDVDWAQAVSRLRGEPVVFLSRPAPIFHTPVAAEGALSRFSDAFGREPAEDAYWRVYELADGGALVVEDVKDAVSLRWRNEGAGPWRSQAFGRGESGAAAGSAKLVGVLDVQQDGQPELVLRRVSGGAGPGKTDEVLLLHQASPRDTFSVLNRLTVHEY